MIRITLVLVLIAACGTRNTDLGNCSLGTEGAACTTGAECCSNDCAGGSCGAVGSCTANGETCTDGQACCSGSCEAGACAPTQCQANGSSCAGGEDCCSGRCQGDTCLPNNSCLAPEADCDPAAADACCSGRCEPVQGMAGVTRCTGICRGNGASCTKATDCCDLNCNGGTCGGEICKVQSDDCTTNAECCSNICGVDNRCELDPANTTCRGIGETCNSGSQMGCCSMVCDETQDPPRCDFAEGVCAGQNATCTMDGDCCNGVCDPGTHLCTTPCVPTTGTCTLNSDCCSSVCTDGQCQAPPDCQPISTGCTADAECCSGLCLAGFCDQLL